MRILLSNLAVGDSNLSKLADGRSKVDCRTEMSVGRTRGQARPGAVAKKLTHGRPRLTARSRRPQKRWFHNVIQIEGRN